MSSQAQAPDTVSAMMQNLKENHGKRGFSADEVLKAALNRIISGL